MYPDRREEVKKKMSCTVTDRCHIEHRFQSHEKVFSLLLSSLNGGVHDFFFLIFIDGLLNESNQTKRLDTTQLLFLS